jgi:hypothetical protein
MVLGDQNPGSLHHSTCRAAAWNDSLVIIMSGAGWSPGAARYCLRRLRLASNPDPAQRIGGVTSCVLAALGGAFTGQVTRFLTAGAVEVEQP